VFYAASNQDVCRSWYNPREFLIDLMMLDIVRSRDPAILDQCDILVDVGGVYGMRFANYLDYILDASKFRFDHHQRGFEERMKIGSKEYMTKLSSAGLIYKHFGKEVVQSFLAEWKTTADQKVVDLLYRKMYDEFVEAFDGIDNGVPCFPKDVQPAYL
jgi:uncharacterized UPF0160 family protein